MGRQYKEPYTLHTTIRIYSKEWLSTSLSSRWILDANNILRFGRKTEVK
jgi:hypothetical protein